MKKAYAEDARKPFYPWQASPVLAAIAHHAVDAVADLRLQDRRARATETTLRRRAADTLQMAWNVFEWQYCPSLRGSPNRAAAAKEPGWRLHIQTDTIMFVSNHALLMGSTRRQPCARSRSSRSVFDPLLRGRALRDVTRQTRGDSASEFAPGSTAGPSVQTF